MKLPLLIDNQLTPADVAERLLRIDVDSLTLQRELNSALVGLGKMLASLETAAFPRGQT